MNEAILHGDLDGTAREALHAKVADEVANMPDLGNVEHATQCGHRHQCGNGTDCNQCHHSQNGNHR